MINRILCIFFISTFLWAECNEGEVELWPDYVHGGCFDIETTTSIDFSNYYVSINDVIPPEIGDLVNQGWRAVVVGDNKTPKNWSFDGIDFLSIDTQNSLYGELSSLLPFNHYCRKNLGYL